MKITNSLSIIPQTPSESIQTKYSLHQKSSQSKGCCTRVLDAIKNIFNRFLDCLKCIFCCGVKKYSSEDASSTNKTQTLSIQTTQVKEKEEKETQTLNKSETGSKEKPPLQKEEAKASLEKKSTTKEKPVNYDKEIAAIQELVKSAPVHPWGPACGNDLCAREIYQKAQDILVKIKNPQSRFEAYIRFADSILKPVLEKLNEKYPNVVGLEHLSGSQQAAQDAITAFDYLLQVRKNCLDFSCEEAAQLKGDSLIHESYLPTRLNIQLLKLTPEWRLKVDKYWDDVESRIYSFLVRKDVAGWNQRSTFFKIFQENFVDFRS